MRTLRTSAILLALAHTSLCANAQDNLAESIAKTYGNGATASDVELATRASLPCPAEGLRITKAVRISAEVTQITVQCSTVGSLPAIAWVKSNQLPQASPILKKASAKKIQEPPLVKAGARATLQLAQQGMLITLPVVTLGPGRAGETIRVMDTTGRLRYRATVISADLLRAELP